MRAFLLSLILFTLLFATAPGHVWDGYLKGCANKALNQSKDHNFTQEELDTITSFTCNYSGEMLDFEVIQDLKNIVNLDMRGNMLNRLIKRYDANTTLDENGTADENATFIWVKTSATLPSWIGTLTNLKNLRLSGDGLSGAIPIEIGNLTNLEVLDLSANYLTKLPSSIGNLISLKEIHLSSNKIVQKLPPELGNLSSLEKLYLQDNKFFGGIPQELGDAMFLKKLRLNQNNLRGEIPSSLTDLDLTQPNGLGLHENCRLYVTFPDCNRSDENDTADCTWWDESNETLHWANNKASLYRGYDGIGQTGGHCWTPAMVPIIWYMLSPTELVRNGNFDDNESYWVSGANWTFNTNAENNSTIEDVMYQDNITLYNQTYYIGFDVNISSGAFVTFWKDTDDINHTIMEANSSTSYDGNYTTVGSNGALYFKCSDCSIDNISVKDGR